MRVEDSQIGTKVRVAVQLSNIPIGTIGVITGHYERPGSPGRPGTVVTWWNIPGLDRAAFSPEELAYLEIVE